MVHSYQGSMLTTSKGVENIFKKAHIIYKELFDEDKQKNIPLIFFDKIDNSEFSANNPLNFIHAELEHDQNEEKNRIGFFGIYYSVFDVNIMNKGILIFIPDSDEEDKKTSLTIGKSNE